MAIGDTPDVDEVMDELLSWIDGRRSYTNTVMDLSEDRAVGIVAVAVADAMVF